MLKEKGLKYRKFETNECGLLKKKKKKSKALCLLHHFSFQDHPEYTLTNALFVFCISATWTITS